MGQDTSDYDEEQAGAEDGDQPADLEHPVEDTSAEDEQQVRPENAGEAANLTA